ncbi:MAG: hypothetical protein IKO53_01515 [Lachnospiraceae bacterium]|nr:hypothetical protein [Lachnospiraceae bacterium]MBR4542867.1 hypothetical protein [Lachnospiraceae bacterium]
MSGKGKKNIIKTVIIMVIVAAVLIGGYVFMTSQRGRETEQSLENETAKEMTAVQKIIAEAPYKEYPATPVQVVKYYNEITKCFYNEKYSDQELTSLSMLSRTLFDQELKDQQSDVDYLVALQADIEVFKASNITIYDSVVSPSTEVEYFTHDGYECARLYSTYTLKSGTVYQSTKEVYILRKDEEGRWKILGFDMVKRDGTQ